MYRYLELDQTHADLQRVIYLTHCILVQMSDLVGQPLLIDRADLLKQNNRIPIESMSFRIDLHMRRQLSLLDLCRDCGDNDSWAEAVTDVILNDQYGTNSSLFRADNWRQVSEIHVASFYNQWLHPAY